MSREVKTMVTQMRNTDRAKMIRFAAMEVTRGLINQSRADNGDQVAESILVLVTDRKTTPTSYQPAAYVVDATDEEPYSSAMRLITSTYEYLMGPARDDFLSQLDPDDHILGLALAQGLRTMSSRFVMLNDPNQDTGIMVSITMVDGTVALYFVQDSGVVDMVVCNQDLPIDFLRGSETDDPDALLDVLSTTGMSIDGRSIPTMLGLTLSALTANADERDLLPDTINVIERS